MGSDVTRGLKEGVVLDFMTGCETLNVLLKNGNIDNLELMLRLCETTYMESIDLPVARKIWAQIRKLIDERLMYHKKRRWELWRLG
jgi:hypothetical protein